MSRQGGASSDEQRRQLLRRAVELGVTEVVGIDPDSKAVGVAISSYVPRHVERSWGLACLKPKQKWGGVMAASELAQATVRLRSGEARLIVVEAMRVRRYGGDSATKNPQSLVDLAFLGGVVAGVLGSPERTVVLPVEPNDWKGSVRKPMHHCRVLAKLGWQAKRFGDHARPETNPSGNYFTPVKGADWKHVMDAVGLALWGVEELNTCRLLYG